MKTWNGTPGKSAARRVANDAVWLIVGAFVLIASSIGSVASVSAARGVDGLAIGASSGERSGYQAAVGEAPLVVAAGGGHEGDGHGAKKPKEPEAEPPIPKFDAIEKLPPADQYCARVGDLAASSQFAQQRKALAKAQEELEVRIKTLTEKSEEIKVWTKRREEFLSKATDGLLAIYGKMKPDAAAAQLIAMNQITAAAIVAKLPPKAASAILAEMEPQRAARLSSVLAGAVELDDKSAAPPATGTP